MKENKIFFPLETLAEFFDIRCDGCPAVLAEDLDREQLIKKSCENASVSLYGQGVLGCTKGLPSANYPVISKNSDFNAL